MLLSIGCTESFSAKVSVNSGLMLSEIIILIKPTDRETSSLMTDLKSFKPQNVQVGTATVNLIDCRREQRK